MKKTAVAILAGLGIATSQPQANIIYSVSDSIRQLQTLAERNTNEGELFLKLVDLTQSVNKLNQTIRSKKYRYSELQAKDLLVVKQLLDFGFEMIKNRYEEQIYNAYYAEFRAFSSARHTLQHALHRITENLTGVQFAAIQGVTITNTDIDEISRQAKAIDS
ncbi:hypothetical protein ACUHGC_02550 [Testudinibacter sp. P27/CKL/0425]